MLGIDLITFSILPKRFKRSLTKCTVNQIFLSFFNTLSKVFNPVNFGKRQGCIFIIDFPNERINLLNKIPEISR